MAPNVTVPMNFGRHLLTSPTHNNLLLNTSEGEVRANSVILSFNSPVISHMTGELHMTSVDMLEFNKNAVKVFVDTAYSGTTENITRDVFRDVNKMANVFEMNWLVGRCGELFKELVDSIISDNYPDLLFIFEEAAYTFEMLKHKELVSLAIGKISNLGLKKQFLEKYLENAERLSTKKLDLVIELAGNEVDLIVHSLTNQLTSHAQGSGIPVSTQYLLDNSNMYLYRESNKDTFEKVVTILEEAAPDLQSMKWVLHLHKKSLIKTDRSASSSAMHQSDLKTLDVTEVRHNNAPAPGTVQNDGYATSTFNMTQITESLVTSDPLHFQNDGVATTSFDLNVAQRNNYIPNLYHSFDMKTSPSLLLRWFTTSCSVTNVLIAAEAVVTLEIYKVYDSLNPKNSMCTVSDDITFLFLMGTRSWSRLPHSLRGMVMLGQKVHNLTPLCVTEEEQYHCRYLDIECMIWFENPWMLLSGGGKLTFYFQHPRIKSCHAPGQCGFILKTVPGKECMHKVELYTAEDDYRHEPVHYHLEIRAERTHLYYVDDFHTILPILARELQ